LVTKITFMDERTKRSMYERGRINRRGRQAPDIWLSTQKRKGSDLKKKSCEGEAKEIMEGIKMVTN